uniref:Uncharacterized protein n=1 Tax=Aegilops tauschii subsp. strangulata TaxID=200361 RepID=A0A453SNC9_AEGTS
PEPLTVKIVALRRRQPQPPVGRSTAYDAAVRRRCSTSRGRVQPLQFVTTHHYPSSSTRFVRHRCSTSRRPAHFQFSTSQLK